MGSPNGRRGHPWRAAPAVFLAVLALAGCGGGSSGGGSPSSAEKASDSDTLNAVLAHELTLADAYGQGLPFLKGEARAIALKFQAQDQEYVDAITKALRGLNGEVDAEREELDFSTVHDAKSMLALAYELESEALAADLGAEVRLYTAAPRSFVDGMAVGHGQHLVVLRQLLGERAVDLVPEAFDGGNAPLPEAAGTTATGEAEAEKRE